MKQWIKMAAAVLVLLVLVGQTSPAGLAANDRISTSPTGYTRAEDVEYIIISGTVVNWGARGEDCTFLSTYAQDYYTSDYSWETLYAKDGGTDISDAYSSPLYMALQSMMKTKHTTIQGYQDTRAYYKYTDCVANDYSLISSFYSGNTVNSTWTGSTYNREHIWPKSKCLYDNKTNDSADIMMLRATITSENSSRGNSAYGESGGYYDPGASVRGDCARMVLYGYVRWGNTGKMWGTGGVMENLDILLKWMEEDPVDTWEMGRNDSVQSITGVRNVFVDYPELAWLLFGEEIPEDMVTPSGNAAEQPCKHGNTKLYNVKDATCASDGYSGDTVCSDCGQQIAAGHTIPATGEHSFGDWITAPGGGKEGRWCSICGYEESRDLPECPHANTEFTGERAPTCTEDGHTGNRLCIDCGRFTEIGEVIPATGHLHTELRETKDAACAADGYTGNTWCTDCGEQIATGTIIPATGHLNTLQETGRLATCAENGYTGDKRCTDCGEVVEPGTILPATGEHDFGESNICKVCGYQQPQEAPEPEPEQAPIWPIIAIAVVVIIIGGNTVMMLIKKKKQ